MTTVTSSPTTLNKYSGVNYWPITNSQMLDTMGGANMLQGSGTLFVADRFGEANSALNLNGGFTTVPTGIYFNTPQFSISVWIYPLNIGFWPRLLDFGNGYPSNNIIVTLDSGNNQRPAFIIVQGTLTPTGYPQSNIPLSYNMWQLLTCTYDGSTQSIYINGVRTAFASLTYSMPSISRTSNLIGKSNYPPDGVSFSYIDQLHFSNVSLSASQIIEMFLSDGQYKSSSLNFYSSLTHYWPITSTQMLTDIVGCTNMVQGMTPVIYVMDRFGNANSAIGLNGGYTQVPAGIYFDTLQFSITLWVYPQSLDGQINSNVFEFANGANLDKITIQLANSAMGSNQPVFGFSVGSVSNGSSLSSSVPLVLNQWQFLAVTYDGATLKMYLNAVLTRFVFYASSSMPYVTRVNNYFGKSNTAGYGGSMSYLDDIRFYNISLTQTQINDLINANDTSSKYNSSYCSSTSTTTITTSKIAFRAPKTN